ncbi:LacI family transcriptional regulator [Hydrogenoanaerobacterium saccharovorans]|uniref:Transcriptional regulator, LacI family n=1 Tax=Hydrogenoanaerobacterium saccharovorans TaxID=474960 RepID=A0A1H7YMY4_9FIRM|nr:LacI family DNA-binding transcriptional regulator [Hydrogenoanaerobacterium saccharovorans]RPF49124.1 LacI family transcriptional regulator [Hydrogenoanaerobacterium saccharovorans]SEM47345.1 transcriptional regulator, LacI family [Hydrogenoanaerobacterium saccharovorans]
MAATMKDIANYTGLGLATISKYFNGGNVLEKNKVAIEQAIEKLDFTVNEFARGLKTSKSKTVGVIIPELSNIFVTNIITIIEDILRKKGYGVIVCDCRTDETLERESVQFLVNKMVDGIINMPVCKDGEHLEPALAKNIPVVLIDRMINNLKARVDAVVVDNVSASEKATCHLIENGHQKIGIVIGPREIFTSQQRLLGYNQAFIKNGLIPDNGLVEYSDYTVQGGYESMKLMLARHSDLTAVFVTNYEMTLGAIIAINELGIKLPQELSVIGFDNMQLSQVVKPKLTIITQPLEEIGEQVAKVMLSRLLSNGDYQPDIITLSTQLQLGESVNMPNK